MKLTSFRSLLLPAVGATLLAPSVNAQLFSYSDQNVLLAFRPATGNSSTETLLVNLGPVSAFYNATQASTFTVGSASAVNSTFPSLANLRYSVSAANKATDGTGHNVLNSIWVSNPRSDVNIQSIGYVSTSTGGTAGKIKGLGDGAVNFAGSSSTVADIPLSSTTKNVGKWVGSGLNQGNGTTGNFQSTFNGGPGGSNVENKTPGTFSASAFTRSDFYEVIPGADSSTYLGFFQFNANGATTFTAVPEPQEYAGLAGVALAGFALWRRARK